jgi:hypothetical protein
MGKKKANKKKKPKKSNLSMRRNSALENLKCQCKNIEDTNKRLLKKIEEDGIDGQYSENSDMLKYAVSVWKQCMKLAEFRKIAEDLKNQ